MTVSGGQHRDSVIHIHVFILFQTPHIMPDNIEQSFTCDTVRPWFVIDFKYSSCTCQLQTPYQKIENICSPDFWAVTWQEGQSGRAAPLERGVYDTGGTNRGIQASEANRKEGKKEKEEARWENVTDCVKPSSFTTYQIFNMFVKSQNVN